MPPQQPVRRPQPNPTGQAGPQIPPELLMAMMQGGGQQSGPLMPPPGIQQGAPLPQGLPQGPPQGMPPQGMPRQIGPQGMGQAPQAQPPSLPQQPGAGQNPGFSVQSNVGSGLSNLLSQIGTQTPTPPMNPVVDVFDEAPPIVREAIRRRLFTQGM